MPSGAYSGASVHFLFSCIPAWGHAKPFCILAARLVQENRNVIVTLLLAPTLLAQAEAIVSAEIHENTDETIRKRLRILSTFKSEFLDLFSLLHPLIQSYEGFFLELWNARPVSCATTGCVFDGVQRPDVVILDFFAHQQMLATRDIAGTSAPIIAWVTGHIAHIIHIFGPSELGGPDAEFTSKINAEMKRTSHAAEEIGDIVYKHSEGAVVKVPGAPPMYDWEFFPQTLPFNAPQWVEIVISAEAGLKECDAVFSTSTYAFEEESLSAFKSWFKKQKKEVYVLGPFLSSTTRAEDVSNYTEVQDFLKNAQAKYGERSVLLISFGTIFWPTVQGYIDEVIEALVEKDFPFIVTHASPFAKISDDLVKKIQDTGIGLILKWAPQQYILDHPATGWFMTHSGQNSVVETLGSGIPMICWPFEADQPIAAAHMSEDLKVAFELIEIRTGDHGMQPMLRNGKKAKGTRHAVGAEFREVIDACRGPQGEEKKNNAQAMEAKLRESWREEGISRNELRTFLHGLEVSCRPL